MPSTEPAHHTADALSQLLSDLNAEARSRRDAEHLFTAALVGALGAIALGAAALSGPHHATLALIAAVLAAVMGGTVTAKVFREHRTYADLRPQQTHLARRLTEVAGLSPQDLPKALRPGSEAGNGHRYSLAIIIASTVVTIGFCFWVAR